ncbi:MAG TPA: Uma2 family endonuclease [Chloroflexota bacterium]|jgi:Uma2 family endonuclease
MVTELAERVAGTPYRFTVDEYMCMAEAGIFDEDSPVELIEGEIVQMAAIGGDHMGCVNALNALLVPALLGRATVSIQNPVRLSNNSEPEPDVVLIRPGLPRNAKPGPADVLLVIEVADSSRLYDRSRKMPLYARSGIAEAWLVDLVAQTIERQTDPSEKGYRQTTLHRYGDTMTPDALSFLRVDVATVLG